MSRLIRLLIALLFLTLAGPDQGARPAAAQETPAAAKGAPPPASASPAPVRTPDPLQEFVPHEKLPADSAVALPVDI
jgi:hypothetical protein